MRIEEFTWSKRQKEIARKIFDIAYLREMDKIKRTILKDISKYKEPKDIWKLHDYLSQKRKETDYKYDYRYSVLIRVFGRLLEEGLINENDLKGISVEKINKIKKYAEINVNL
jgi:hypothetical protein